MANFVLTTNQKMKTSCEISKINIPPELFGIASIKLLFATVRQAENITVKQSHWLIEIALSGLRFT